MNQDISINVSKGLMDSLYAGLHSALGDNYGEFIAFVIVGLFIYAIIALIVLIINKVADFFIFKKVGEAPHKCFIPCYSEYMSYNYAGIPLVYFVMWIVPIIYVILVNVVLKNNNDAIGITSIVYLVVVIVISAYKCFRISKRFGHGIGWAIGLFFLWPFFKLALGLGQSQYNKDA